MQNVFPDESFSPLDSKSFVSTLLSLHSQDENSKQSDLYYQGGEICGHKISVNENLATSVLMSASIKTDNPN